MNAPATPRPLRLDFDEAACSGERRLSSSLDGFTPARHDASRGHRDTWDWTLQAFAARRTGIPVQITPTISCRNLAGSPEVVRPTRDALAGTPTCVDNQPRARAFHGLSTALPA